MAIKSSDQVTVVDLTDAYSVILTNDSYTFPGSTSAALAGSCTTQIIAMRGGTVIPATVNLSNVTKPTGITVTKDSDATSPTLTITASTSFTQAGVVTIPVQLESGSITINKVFSVAIAFTGAQGIQGIQGIQGETGATGATGKGVSSVTVTYQAGSSNSTAPTGSWVSSPPAVSEGQYLWTKMVLNYTDNTSSNPLYSVAKQGVSGTSAQWYTGTGITGTSTTPTVFSGSGVSGAKVGDMYLNTSTWNTYRCTLAGNASTAKWVYVNNIRGAQGETGAAGADAITLSITSSNGLIFKNTAVETVLTAHVYKAGAEVTGSALTALGTIKWYKNGGSTAVGTGATLTISTGDVTDRATYVAQLES